MSRDTAVQSNSSKAVVPKHQKARRGQKKKKREQEKLKQAILKRLKLWDSLTEDEKQR